MHRTRWPARAPAEVQPDDEVLALVPVVRRVVGARVKDPHTVEDLTQETIARVVASRDRVQGNLAPYAIVTAKHLVAELAKRGERERRHAPRLIETDDGERPGDDLLRAELRSHVGAALGHLDETERQVLIAHEVHGDSTSALAASHGSTPGAIAAQLARSRAKLRVEYLLEREHVTPPTDRCRPVLRSLSSSDRRRQRELDARGHLLECDVCRRLADALAEHRTENSDDDRVLVPVTRDADVVTARHRGREVAATAGFGPTDQTVVATAISELARNVVKFAERGEVEIRVVEEQGAVGVRVAVRDAGPGIADVEAAMQDGFSTYAGLGLGLPGSRRLMDELDVVSEVGRGTTVTATKWRSTRATDERRQR